MQAETDYKRAFERLVNIMDELREKCPWDKKQDIHSLRHLTIEETYELGDAIIQNDYQAIKEELGDLLLHIVFYARIGREQNEFNLQEVIDSVCDKLVVRHPHIYGDVQVENEEDVKQNWEKIKLKQGKKSVLEGVPVSLPAIVKAIRLQEKSKQVGFEWENKEQVWHKVKEELAEFEEALEKGDTKEREEEFGDLLFSLINYSRFIQVDAEAALEKTNQKFIHRFKLMEAEASQTGKMLSDMTLQEMDDLWTAIKNRSKQN